MESKAHAMAEIGRLVQRVATLEAEQDKLKAERDALKSELDKSRLNIKSDVQRYKRAQAERDAIDAENGEYFMRLEVLKDECKSLNDQRDVLIKALGEVSRSLIYLPFGAKIPQGLREAEKVYKLYQKHE